MLRNCRLDSLKAKRADAWRSQAEGETRKRKVFADVIDDGPQVEAKRRKTKEEKPRPETGSKPAVAASSTDRLSPAFAQSSPSDSKFLLVYFILSFLFSSSSFVSSVGEIDELFASASKKASGKKSRRKDDESDDDETTPTAAAAPKPKKRKTQKDLADVLDAIERTKK